MLYLFCTFSFSAQHFPKPFQRSFIDFRYLTSLNESINYNFSDLPITPTFPFQYPSGIELSSKEQIQTRHGITLGAYPIINTHGENYSLRSIFSVDLDQITVYNSMILNTQLKDNPDYTGFSWRNFTGYAEEGYFSYLNHHDKIGYGFLFGRFFDQWGEGRTGQLFLSSVARPLDQFKLKFETGGFTFISKIAQLDKQNNYNRYFFSHRLMYRNTHLQFGFSEAVLYGGVGENIEFAYLNPFVIFHGEKKNGPGLDSNTMLSVDGRYFLKNASIYFEFLIDDFQADKQRVGELEPNEVGLIVGSDIALDKFYIGLEFVAVTNRTYKTPHDYEWYLHRDAPIGYGEGSDLWRANAFGRYYFSEKWQFDIEFDYLVKGEGEMSTPWDEPWMEDGITLETGYSEPFPTGILEKKLTSTFGVFRMYDYNKWISLELNYFTIQNNNHILNTDKKDFEISVEFSWLFTKEFKLE